MKKLLTIVLVLSMVISLVACSNNSESKNGSDTTESTSDTTSSDSSTGSEVPELKGAGNITLKRLGYNAPFDPNEDIISDLINELTGYDVEYYTLPADSADEKLVMEIAGGSDYDLLQISPSQYQTLLSQEVLMPLNDLLETYGQDILEGVSEVTWSACSDNDGNIYGIPYKYPYATEVQSFIAGRWDLMEAAGITSIPTTLDEFYDCLKTLKDYYGDEYIILAGPYRTAVDGNATWIFPQIIACAFGIYNDWMVDDDGNVFYMTEHSNFPAMVDYLSMLENEGLLDPDWAANTSATVNEKFAGGKCILSTQTRQGLSETLPSMIDTLGITYDDIAIVAPLEGEGGLCEYMKTEAVNFYTVILKGNENAADAVNWINLKQQEQLYINIGVEGTHFTYDEVGSISPINPIFSDERGNSYWYIDSTNEAEFATQWPSRVRKSEDQWVGFDGATIQTNAERPDIFVDNPFAFKSATENYSKYNTALFSNLNDYILQILAGTKTIDDLDNFTQEWEASGGSDIKTELQDWYHEFYK